jgi:hypothetical protein
VTEDRLSRNLTVRGVSALFVTVCCVLGWSAGVSGATVTAAPAAPGTAAGVWSPVRLVLNPEHYSITVSEVSCPAPGDCTAAGTYSQFVNGGQATEGFVMGERGGVWGGIEPVPGLESVNTGGDVTASALSCPSAGNCVLAGSYVSGVFPAKQTTTVFVASERDGTWQKAGPVPGVSTLDTVNSPSIVSLSCGAPGDCAVVGLYMDKSTEADDAWDPFLATETGGRWSAAREVPGYAALAAYPPEYLYDYSVSCAGPGDCSLIGNYYARSTQEQAFVLDQVRGTWGTARPLPGDGTYSGPGTVSCVSPGNCIASGTFLSGSMPESENAIWRESGGTWSGPKLFTGLDGIGQLSCGAAADCTALATSQSSNDLILTESNGVWGAPQPLPGLAALGSTATKSADLTALSCYAPGDCSVGGYYFDSDNPETGDVGSWDFVVDETNGKWGQARHLAGLSADRTAPGEDLALTELSCTRGGFCGAAGQYDTSYDYEDYQGAFVANRIVPAATSTTLALSAHKAAYGREQAVRVSVAVRAKAGTPGGKVAVTAGQATLCVITLKSGKGACTLTPKRLGGGTYQIAARYQGSTDFTTSASAKQTLVVAS